MTTSHYTLVLDGPWVHVLFRHSVVVSSPKRIVLSHTRLFTIHFGTSVSKSKSRSSISLFVLELQLPDRKAEVKFHYLFWKFRSQIEKRKPIGQNKLSLATAHFFTIRFGTSVPKMKSGSYIHYLFWNFRFQIKKRKLVCHNLLWNKSKRRPLFILEVAFQIEERTLKRKLDLQFHTEVENVNVTIP